MRNALNEACLFLGDIDHLSALYDNLSRFFQNLFNLEDISVSLVKMSRELVKGSIEPENKEYSKIFRTNILCGSISRKSRNVTI